MTFPASPRDGEAPSDQVEFHGHGVELPAILRDVPRLQSWLAAVAKTHGARVRSLSYVLCDDAFLHEMNVERLGHDTLTDIITFDLSDGAMAIAVEGECYISLPRVLENATAYGPHPGTTTDPGPDARGGLDAELLRVIAHGLLHLCGLGGRDPNRGS